ncbi:MAG: ATP-dependent DNA helicase RecG [Desulfitobacteriia bacterium]|jgi:ATP-dependent DNA helicase RecG
MENMIPGLLKALRAEEKQGYINTGALGGFSFFLSEALPFLKECLPAEEFEELRMAVSEYRYSAPQQRRRLHSTIKKHLESLNIKKPSSLHKNNKNIGPQNLQYLKGVGPRRAKLLAKLDLKTVEDLLRYWPRRYEVRTKRKIEDLRDNELATVSGLVTGSQVSTGRIKVVKLKIEQEGRSIFAIWFNQTHIPKQFPIGTEVVVLGKVRWNKRIPEIHVFEISKGGSEGPEEEIVPVYSETKGLNSKTIRALVRNALPEIDKYFREYLPPGEQELLKRQLACKELHFPSSLQTMEKARERMVIEEILFLQLAFALLRQPREQKAAFCLNKGQKLVDRFLSTLSFELTAAQKRVIAEIFRDLADNRKPMARLLQGDVGSGKTVVAMAALLQTVGSGYQAAMMAPTEVLARQHYQVLSKAFRPLGVEVVLLTGAQRKKEREQILDRILRGEAQIVTGTQALIQETVRFKSLGFVVTDEQHRFGVRQRTLLQDKGENPHVLVMTATPIPRTLALTLYGDLQLSVLDEMPPGRKPVITRKLTARHRSGLEKFLEHHLKRGTQVYVVCPLLKETENSDLLSATETAERLQKRFPTFKIALLHGGMKSQDKEEIMLRFRQGEINILVATTVVEVGVDVPNASIMVIEGAERFGLAQLHQLRGRVGRGEKQSYCFLVSDATNSTRLEILCQTEDGFKIAEEDLKIRGPGELLGLKQHGLPELKLTDLSRDGVLVERAYNLSQKALAEPEKYELLFQEVKRFFSGVKVGIN